MSLGEWKVASVFPFTALDLQFWLGLHPATTTTTKQWVGIPEK